MSGIEPQVWAQLESSRPSGDELIGRKAAADVSARLLAALDARGRRHLLVSLLPGDEAYQDTGSRGLTVSTRELTLKAREASRYIDILCEDAIGHPMLDLIGAEIAARLHAAEAVPAEDVARVLAKWRRFWGQLPKHVLSQEAQIGLFAELWFLTYWLIPAVGVSSALRMWRGPRGARHDFERPGLSVECKGTSSTRGRIHQINGLRQLEAPENGRLLFFSLRLREEAGAENTLPILCRVCREIVSPDAEAEEVFDAALIAVGYLPVYEDEYSRMHWHVLEELLFDTGGDFPRITTHTFAPDPPAGVEELAYTINLGTFDRLIAARTPAGASALLDSAAAGASHT